VQDAALGVGHDDGRVGQQLGQGAEGLADAVAPQPALQVQGLFHF